jgi:hypothetical protein
MVTIDDDVVGGRLAELKQMVLSTEMWTRISEELGKIERSTGHEQMQIVAETTAEFDEQSERFPLSEEHKGKRGIQFGPAGKARFLIAWNEERFLASLAVGDVIRGWAAALGVYARPGALAEGLLKDGYPRTPGVVQGGEHGLTAALCNGS